MEINRKSLGTDSSNLNYSSASVSKAVDRCVPNCNFFYVVDGKLGTRCRADTLRNEAEFGHTIYLFFIEG